jgi:hypothetical protein
LNDAAIYVGRQLPLRGTLEGGVHVPVLLEMEKAFSVKVKERTHDEATEALLA